LLLLFAAATTTTSIAILLQLSKVYMQGRIRRLSHLMFDVLSMI